MQRMQDLFPDRQGLVLWNASNRTVGKGPDLLEIPSSVKWDVHVSLANFKDCDVISTSDCWVHFSYFNVSRMFNAWCILKKVISDTFFTWMQHTLFTI